MVKQWSQSSDSDNPFADLPVPNYAKEWDKAVYRPKTLPTVYDSRVDPEHIFALPEHPFTGEELEYYIVAHRCTNCARVRQVCSRGDPACRRCVNKKLSCIPVETGYVEVPLPKTVRPTLRKEVQALKNSLPDAPYYREHSASVAKSLSLPEDNDSTSQKALKPLLKKDSISMGPRGPKGSDIVDQGRSNAIKHDSKRQAPVSLRLGDALVA
jgi:hypothetical protein